MVNSTEIWVAVLAISALVIVAIAAIYYNLGLHKKLVAQFKKLGENLDLELTEYPPSFAGLMQRPPSLYGHFRNRELSIYAHGYGLDNTRQTDTAIRMQTKAPQDFQISFARRGTMSKIGQVGRLKQCKTGDSAFDETFSLRSNNPQSAKHFFGEELRALITEAWSSESGFLTLGKQKLTYVEFGLPHEDSKREHLEKVTALCCEIAEALDIFK